MRHCLLQRLLFLPTVFFSATLLLSIGWSPAASGAEMLKEIDIDYERKRIGRSTAGRPSLSQPAAGALPPALAVPGPIHGSRSYDEKASDKQGDHHTTDGIITRAAVAATWTVQQQVRIFGRREIYQAGLHDGLKQAFDDPLLGDWDYQQGHRAGRGDRDAYRIGSKLGSENAQLRAGKDAYTLVKAQFHDLTREPRQEAAVAAHPASTAPDMASMPTTRKPILREVFAALPLSSMLKEGGSGPLPDAFKLNRDQSYNDFYDRRWTETSQAWAYWLDHNRDRAFWHQLSGEERARFAKIFRSTYRLQLPEILADTGESAYAHGHGDGWQYGALVAQEWSYRKGFHNGFTSALQDHARSAFQDHYPRIFDDRYGELFREWSTTAKPEIRELFIADGSGDGVFEPGERVLINYELVNYGGQGEWFQVSLEGAPLKTCVGAEIYLPRRHVLRSQTPVAARIDPSVPPRTSAELELTVGGLGRRVAFRIAYPLELDDRVVLGSHNTFGGRTRIEVTIANQSRRPTGGEVAVHFLSPSGQTLRDGGFEQAPAERIDLLEAGASRLLSFPIAGLDPLDLLDGKVEVSFVVHGRDASGRDAIFDHLDQRLPELSPDLDSGDFEDSDFEVFMQEAALRQPPTRSVGSFSRLTVTASRGESANIFGGAMKRLAP